MKRVQKPRHNYAAENRELKLKLDEAEETLAAIRRGEVDALVVSGPEGERVFKLESADSTYRRLVETMSEGAATVGADGSVLYCNPRLQDMLGLPAGKIVGTPLESFVRPADRAAFGELFRKGSPRPGRREVVLQAGGGALVPVLAASSSLDDEGGVACLVFTDLSDLKAAQADLEKANAELEKRVVRRTAQLEKSNRALRENALKYRGLFDNIRESVEVYEAVRDQSGEIAEAVLREGNAALAREAGVKSVALIKGRTAVEIFGRARADDKMAVIREVITSGRPKTVEIRDGERGRDFLKTFVPLDRERCLVIGPDVTARKRAEEALLAARAELETRVSERTAELNRTVGLLSQERKRFHDVLDILPAYVILLTPDYHVPFANRFFMERFGDSGGRRCYEYLFKRDTPCENCETYEVLETKAPKTWQWIGPDGRTYSIFDFPFTDADGATFILEMGIDVTDRLRAEAELARHRDRLEELVAERTGQLERANARLLKEVEERRRAEDRLRFQASILDTVGEAVVGTDTRFNIVYWNKGAEKIYGWQAEEILGRPGGEVLRSRLTEEERVAYAESLGRGETITTLFEQTTKDGRWLSIEGYSIPVRNAEGVITGFAAVNRDITDRLRAEKEIQDQARFPSENPNPILRLTPDGIVLYCNEAGEELTRLWDCGPGRPLPEPWRGMAVTTFARGVDESAEIPCGDRVFAFVIVPIPDRGYINLYGKDITERKQAEADLDRSIAELREANEDLKASRLAALNLMEDARLAQERAEAINRELVDTRNYLNSLLDYANAPIIVWDTAYKITLFNHAFERMTGYAAADVIGQDLSVLFPLDSREDILNKINGTLRGEYWEVVEIPILRRDGGVRTALWNSANIYAEDGETLRATIAQGQDITERLRAERSLQESEARYRTLFNGMTEGFGLHEIVCDAEGVPCDYRFLDVNPAYEQLTGLKRDDVVGRLKSEVPRLRGENPDLLATYGKVALSGEPVHFENYSPADKEHFEVFAFRPAPLRFAVVFLNITDRKRAEEVLKRDRETFERLVEERTRELVDARRELEQSKRLSDIGTLAATVAHELRNPLAAINIASYNIGRKARDPVLDPHLATIKKKVTESDQIINNLLFYSRIKYPHYERTEVDTLIAECLSLTDARFKSSVTVRQALEGVRGVAVNADPLQLKEVFSNILNNAYDAIADKPEGAAIEIRAGRENERVRISITDNGVGIPGEYLEKLFEPFFTTKAKGTGLGLAVCRQIVTLHGGTIRVDSAPGVGTTVEVHLPCLA